MASSKCSAFGCKRVSDTLCAHCQSNVCSKHYIEHVKLANDELVPLADRLNSLVNSIQQTDSVQKVFQQIDEWREMNYRRIDKFCNEKKRELKAKIEQNIEIQISKLRKLSQQVKELIDEGDASFKQIENIKEDIVECQKQCKQFEKTDYINFDIKIIENETICTEDDLFIGGGTLLLPEQQIKLNEFYGKQSQKWMLIYKATKDGFAGRDFHRCCNNQGPTMTVIQSKRGGYLFGGYTYVSWSSKEGYVKDNGGPFLFTLTNPHDIPPTKYSILEIYYAINNKKENGPIFGSGHDLYVCNENETEAASYFFFPCSYHGGVNQGSETFTGNSYSKLSEIEVYRLA